jgi:hypothetical protein
MIMVCPQTSQVSSPSSSQYGRVFFWFTMACALGEIAWGIADAVLRQVEADSVRKRGAVSGRRRRTRGNGTEETTWLV